MAEFRSMPGLWQWYEQSGRQLAFQAQSAEEAVSWQQNLREIVRRLLGGFQSPVVDFDPQIIETEQTDGYTRELMVIQTQPGEHMPCYVLTPHNPVPHKTLIALHGHGTFGVKSIVGIADSAAETQFIQAFNMDYGRQLALQGFRVYAPLLRGFAERMETPPTDGDMWQSSCKTLSLNAMLCGKTLLGMRLVDVMRLIDYIGTRNEAEKLGCVGFSGGGTLAMYLTALDDRIGCAYLSGSVNTFRDSLMSIEHCPCNYVPGILQYAEMGDLAGLIAPCPLLVEAGEHDPIYPIVGAKQALETLRQIYGCFDANDRLGFHIFDGEHRWDGSPAAEWFAKWL